MKATPYHRFRNRDLTLTDYLAIDRTVLANERTLLAYGRTALGMVVVGGTIIRFLDALWLHGLGAGFIVAGFGVLGLGWRRYLRVKALLSAALEELQGEDENPALEERAEEL